MASRLDKMLQPGERVLYRPGIGVADCLKFWLVIMAVLLPLLAIWIVTDPAATKFLVAAAAALATGCLLHYIWHYRLGTLLTDRRLLYPPGPTGRRINDLALNWVTRVHGLTQGSRLPVQLETAKGGFVTPDALFFARDLGRAVARAAGLPLPGGPASAAERRAGLLYAADAFGGVLGIILFFVSLFICADLIEATLGPASGGFITFALYAFGILFGCRIGTTIGRVTGPILAILWLRPTVSTEDMREAIGLLVQRGLLLRADDHCRRFQPMILGVASLVYGQPIAPPNASGERPAP